MWLTYIREYILLRYAIEHCRSRIRLRRQQKLQGLTLRVLRVGRISTLGTIFVNSHRIRIDEVIKESFLARIQGPVLRLEEIFLGLSRCLRPLAV